MPEAISIDKSLAEAVTKFVDSLHHMYSGWPVSELSTPKQVKVEAGFHAAFFHSDWPTE